MKHRVKLHHQKIAILEAYEKLKDYYPQLIKDGKAIRDVALTHMDYLTAALETIDGLDEGRDMRETLN